MTKSRLPTERGFALIIVLIVITVLGLLAGSFAYAMKIESRLAINASNDSEMEWLGRSGVEFARYVLANTAPANAFSLNQFWAGGPGTAAETNGPLAGLSLKDNQLGAGWFSVEIRDLDRKWNINAGNDQAMGQILQRALAVIGVDAGESATIADSVLDWRDRDDATRLSGAESDFYLLIPPPYVAKNGPLDDLAELLLVQGITPALYWGPAASQHSPIRLSPLPGGRRPAVEAAPAYPVGLVDLFAPLGSAGININTASFHALQVLPGVDENIAQTILQVRAGPDGMDGTEDDMPFMGANFALPGVPPEFPDLMRGLVTTVSTVFEVTVDARLGSYRRKFYALVSRANAQNPQVLHFSWR
ncbi:MAG: general secretion pathway protein GspK [Verrucomicrobia bacterium]|nr:general secretion pathway protein GspK [Verrucomicrobiota bacterium]